MSAEHSRLDEEEVLLAFSVEHKHDQATLERYLSQYPEHAHALVDCSIELMMDFSLAGENAQVSSDESVEKAWQQFQAAMESIQGTAGANPFAQLTPTAFKTVAKRLDISNLFLIRVRERAIDAATIPWRFVQRLATELGAAADAVSAYLRSPPAMVSNQSFRSNVKPEVAAQISFEQAIDTSQLTPAQREALRALRD
ncbi:hypothetical protein AWB79_02670 [Caballeronia hypogeia]|uniref:Uncharacterized protein n=1 Tax=Caballeronia hypogeia TaxID=1777140 RepID=A0A158ARA4_9BURK|nr:hypothetical protein [Caballeronia hypogeia]SAK60006.1 hypothetical protein AWB79_02670 [Caballeronia hypogeia]